MKEVNNTCLEKAQIALDKITKEFFKNEKNRVYHYTSAQGLKGILETTSLWFTKSDYLNDLTETNYIIEVLEEVLKEYDDHISFCEFIRKNVIEQSLSQMNIEKRNEYYICSFSRAADELSLWNYYTKSPSKAGYNIGIKIDDLVNSMKQLNTKVDVNFGDVIYNIKIQKELLFNVLKELFVVYKENEDEAKNDLLDIIMLLAPFLKHPTFKNEKECRIVLSVSVVEDIRKEMQIREQNGIFVPYLKLQFDKKVVKKVVASPYIVSENVINSLFVLLNKYEYKANCIKSKIPLRN